MHHLGASVGCSALAFVEISAEADARQNSMESKRCLLQQMKGSKVQQQAAADICWMNEALHNSDMMVMGFSRLHTWWEARPALSSEQLHHQWMACPSWP